MSEPVSKDIPKLYPIQLESSLQLPNRHVFRFTEKQAQMVYKAYAERFPGQSFDQIHARGGFGLLEAFYFLTGEFIKVEDRK